MDTKPRTWRPLDEANVLLTGDGCDASQGITVKVVRYPWETERDFPARLAADAASVCQVLTELLVHGCADREIGAFVREILTPEIDGLRALGVWRWTGFVRRAVPRELSPWSDTPDL